MFNTTIIEGAENINAYRLLALKGALKLETLGMKNSRLNAAAIVRGELLQRGVKPACDKKSLLVQFTTILQSEGILR
jgi:hypothetical protein